MQAQAVVGDDLDLLPHQHLSVSGMQVAFTAGPFLHVIYGIARYSGAKTLVEIGVADGSMSTLLAQVAYLNSGHCWGVDVDAACEIVIRNRLATMKFGPQWTFLFGDSAEVGRRWLHGPIDFLFIDGGHEYKQVVADLQTWLPQLAPNGHVCVHDTHNPERADVRKATDEFLMESGINWDALYLDYDSGLLMLRRKKRPE